VVAALTLAGVEHRRGDRTVLRVDRLGVEPGERLAVLGPNGAGKTTMLRLLAGLEPPTHGQVLIGDVDPASLPAQDRVRLRRRVGYVTQHATLLAGTTVARNVELPLAWRGVPRAQRRERALHCLAAFGVAHLARRKAHSLSGGEAQRVSLARALATRPGILLLDEPAASLDPASRASFLADVELVLGDRATTLVHVSHRPEEALRLADRVAVLVEGRLRQVATPLGVITSPGDATVARLVGYENVLNVHVDDSGQVLIDGTETGATATTGPGPATLAAWARAVHLTSPTAAPLQATVESVSPGPGRWEAILTGPATLRAHLALDEEPPQAGERVGIRIDSAHAAVILRTGASRSAKPSTTGPNTRSP
jgi:ABC-type sulfate/molybdate transport systems ATPase subunit